MLKLNSFKIFSCLWFATNTCFASPISNVGESQLKEEKNNQVIEQNVRYNRTNQKNRPKTQQLKLSDFKGEWIGGSQSIGGLSGNDKIGNVQSNVMQATIDSNGRGNLNYGRITFYEGVPGEIKNTIKDQLYEFSIKIINAEKGVISIIFYSLAPSVELQTSSTYFAVVNRNKKTGEVTSIIGQRVEREPSTVTNVLKLEMHRQY